MKVPPDTSSAAAQPRVQYEEHICVCASAEIALPSKYPSQPKIDPQCAAHM